MLTDITDGQCNHLKSEVTKMKKALMKTRARSSLKQVKLKFIPWLWLSPTKVIAWVCFH